MEQFPTALQKIELTNCSVPLYIKREDLIHPYISGNKWRKLKYNLSQLSKVDQVLSFGGAFSNHILATAVACRINEIESIGIIRTENIDEQNPTLKAARKYGMKLYAMNRSEYSNKTEQTILNNLRLEFPKATIIPEGGSNRQAIQGMQEMCTELSEQISTPIHVLCSYGTGATAAGILASNRIDYLTILPAIRGLSQASFDSTQTTLLDTVHSNYSILQEDPHIRYAKKSMLVFEFAEYFLKTHKILLDPIYTSKALYYLTRNTKYLSQEKANVFIHTGGVQAWGGYFYRFPALKKELPEIYKSFTKDYPELNV